jgi:hypothetical protein
MVSGLKHVEVVCVRAKVLIAVRDFGPAPGTVGQGD